MNVPALSPWTLPALRQRWQPRLPGLMLVGLIAAASLYLAELPWLQAHGLSALTVAIVAGIVIGNTRSEEHTSELQSQSNLVCRLLLEKKKKKKQKHKAVTHN